MQLEIMQKSTALLTLTDLGFGRLGAPGAENRPPGLFAAQASPLDIRFPT